MTSIPLSDVVGCKTHRCPKCRSNLLDKLRVGHPDLLECFSCGNVFNEKLGRCVRIPATRDGVEIVAGMKIWSIALKDQWVVDEHVVDEASTLGIFRMDGNKYHWEAVFAAEDNKFFSSKEAAEKEALDRNQKQTPVQGSGI